MDLLSIIFFLAASLVYANAETIYGRKKDSSRLIVRKTGDVDMAATVTFNEDGKYDITIDMLTITYNPLGMAASSEIVHGGISHADLILNLITNYKLSTVEVAIYGRFNNGRQESLVKEKDVKFSKYRSSGIVQYTQM